MFRAVPRHLPPFITLAVEVRLTLRVPLMFGTAECGFPSPADDYLDTPLDFNELLIENPPATFSVRAAGDCMIGIGIGIGIVSGDIAVVNRAKLVTDRATVIALVNGELAPHVDELAVGIFAAATDQPSFVIDTWEAGKTTFNADEAVAAGLAHEILDSKLTPAAFVPCQQADFRSSRPTRRRTSRRALLQLSKSERAESPFQSSQAKGAEECLSEDSVTREQQSAQLRLRRKALGFTRGRLRPGLACI